MPDICVICGHPATEPAACDDCRTLIAAGLLDEEPAEPEASE